jgi:hypothetical protein
MKYEIVVGAVSNRDCWRRFTNKSSRIAVGNRSYERIAIVEQAMSFYGTAVSPDRDSEDPVIC